MTISDKWKDYLLNTPREVMETMEVYGNELRAAMDRAESLLRNAGVFDTDGKLDEAQKVPFAVFAGMGFLVGYQAGKSNGKIDEMAPWYVLELKRIGDEAMSELLGSSHET